jgi:hypothetical protein
MAWTTVPTFVSGNILTAAQMNGLGTDLNEVRGDWATSRYTTGNLTLNSTTWANVGGPADLVLAADAGDVVQVNISCAFGNEAVDAYLDVATIVGSTVTNSFGANGTPSNTHQGILSWRGLASIYPSVGAGFWYKLVSGDISSSTVTLRLRYRTSTATNKVIFCATDYPFSFFARNHGPIEI